MRWTNGVRLLALALVFVSCDRGASRTSQRDPQQQQPAVAPPPSTPTADTRVPCPKAKDASAAVKIGTATRLPVEAIGGLAWRDGDGWDFLADDATTPRPVNEHELSKLAPEPEPHLKRRCGAGGCSEHGGNSELVLVDHNVEHVIATGQSAIEAAQIVGDDVVWVTFGTDAVSGGVFRAPAGGGPATKFWDGAVEELLVDGRDAYAAGSQGVAWIDLQSGKTTVLAPTEKRTRSLGLTLHGDRLFWADEGDPYWASAPSGKLLSAPRHGGKVTTHAAALPWPSAIVVDGDLIYYGSRDKGGVWAIPIGGGTATAVMSPDGGCGGISWMRRIKPGLLVVRGDTRALPPNADVWFVPLAERKQHAR